MRLAERVFAPHYAAPMPCELHAAAELRSAPAGDADILAGLSPGDAFEVLELAGGNAWGVAPRVGLVGYICASALGEAK